MAQTFPTSVPIYPDTAGGEVLGSAGGGVGLSRILDDYGLDIIALAQKAGTGSSTPASGKVLRATGTGTSEWGKVSFANDIDTFSSSDLRGLLTDETGSGAAVFATSPTIVTPTIASFANATHTHANAAGGGTLNGANAIDDGSLTPAELMTGTGTSWAMQTWAPTFTNLSGGTLNFAQYIQMGKIVFFRFKYTLAGAGVSGAVEFTLPVVAAANEVRAAIGAMPHGLARYDDTGTNSFYGTFDMLTNDKGRLLVWDVGTATYMTVGTLSSTVPHVWANTDVMFVEGWYEAA